MAKSWIPIPRRKMAYDLSFSERFFLERDQHNVAPSPQPTTIYQAIVSMQEKQWNEVAREVFGVEGSQLQPEAVFDRVVSTNTCSNLDSPVQVWIDAEGVHTLLVYDDLY